MDTTRIRRAVTALALVFGAGLVGCGPENEPIDRESQQQIEAAADELQRDLAEFRADVEARLESVGEQVEDLRARLEDASAETREQLDPRLAELEQEKQRLQRSLQNLRAESEQAWMDAKTRINRALADLERSLDEIEASLRSEV